ncbi:hypothetical protein ST4_086 [Aeromonas phage ST4]|nr:hypothetical protein ST4_086 [Aeromonas phage ST4]
MPKVICELENSSTEINGIKFVFGEDGRLISEADVGEPHLSIFLSIPGYFVEGDEDGDDDHKDPVPSKEPEPVKETAAQRKARLKAEKEAADKAEDDHLAAEEAQRLAEEEAQRVAAEEAAKQQDQNNSSEGSNGAGTGEQEEVF